MAIILDTNILIHLEIEPNAGKKLIKSFSEEVFYITAVTVSELLAGVDLAKNAQQKIQRSIFVDKILKEIPVLNFDVPVAKVYAKLYAHVLKRKGRATQNAHDLQIAATAVYHAYPLMTLNQKDFKGLPGLQLVSL